jgi:transposase
MRMPRKRMEMPSREELYDLYWNKGMSLRELGNRYGVSEMTMFRWLKKLDIPTRCLGCDAERYESHNKKPEREELEELYVKMGFSIRKIAEQFGVHPDTVRKWIREYGITKNSSDCEVMDLKDFENVDLSKYKQVQPYVVLVPEPIKIKSRDATLTLVISDTHFGHSDFMPKTFYSTVNSLKQALKHIVSKYSVKAFRIVLNGDIVSGREVYATQYIDNILQRGNWQVYLAEVVFKELFDEIEKIVPVDEIYLIRGTHEAAGSENYQLYLKKAFVADGYNCKYASKGIVLDIGKPVGHYNVLFTHGFGSTDYSPVSPVCQRDLIKAIADYKLDGIPIERCCVAHSHWLTSEFEISEIPIEVTGGFQKWSRTQSQRPPGFILYLYVSQICVPIKIRPDPKIVAEERRSPNLEYENIRFYGAKLLEHYKKIEERKDEEKQGESAGETERQELH